MAYYIRLKHVEELTNKYIIQCYNLEWTLWKYNIVAWKIRNVKFKNDILAELCLPNTSVNIFLCTVLYVTVSCAQGTS